MAKSITGKDLITTNGLVESNGYSNNGAGTSGRGARGSIGSNVQGISSPSDLIKIVVTNDASGTPDRANLGNFETDMKKLVKIVREASNEGTYFSAKLKDINTVTGKAVYEMYIQASERENVMASLEKQIGKWSVSSNDSQDKQKGKWSVGSHGANYALQEMPVNYAVSTMLLHGKEAQEKAKKEISDVAGGQIIPASGKNPDRYKVLIPLPSDVPEDDKTWINARKKEIFTESSKLSRAEGKRRKEAEAEEKRKEEERNTETQVAQVALQKKEADKANKDLDKLLANFEKEDESIQDKITKQFIKNREDVPLENARDFEKRNQGRFVREAQSDEDLLGMLKEANAENDEFERTVGDKEGDKLAKEQEKITASSKRSTSIAHRIASILILLTDIVRRILTASLKQTIEAEKTSVTLHGLGVTSEEGRQYGIFETAHGLDKGSFVNAISTVQEKFGDVTNLDEKSLGVLARVMGNDVADMVNSGMGGKNPAMLLNNILDKYFAQFKAGKNSLGQYVGQMDAMRELSTVLQGVSPEIAKIFTRMADDYLSGRYGAFQNTSEWQSSTITNRTGLRAEELKYNQEVGKTLNNIKSTIEDLKTAYLLRMANTLSGIFERISNWKIGMSAEKKIEEDVKAKKHNEELGKRLKAQNILFSQSTKSRVEELSTLEQVPVSKGGIFQAYNESQAKRFKYDLYTLARIQSGIEDKDLLNVAQGIKGESELKAYRARALDIINNIAFSKDLSDEFGRILANNKAIEKIEENKDKKAGEGIDFVYMSDAKQTVQAEEEINDIKLNLLNKKGVYSDFTANEKETVRNAMIEQMTDDERVFKQYYEKYVSSDKKTSKEFSKTLKTLAKEKGIENYSSYKEAPELWHEAVATVGAERWYSTNFGTVADKKGSSERTYLQAGIQKGTSSYIADSDSAVVSLLDSIASSILEKDKSYSVSGKSGKSGEYVFTLQIVDEKGTKIGEPIQHTVLESGLTKNFSGTVKLTGDKMSYANVNANTAE